MMHEIDDEWEYLEELDDQRPRDTKIDEAKEVLMRELFEQSPEQVYYGRQVEVLFERRFFHWIIARALGELARSGAVSSTEMVLEGQTRVRFYWSTRNRYWRRKAQAARRLILEYSKPSFCRGLGHHAETMFTAALATVGFMPTSENVRSYRGVEWVETGHDLDRVFERDKVAYGTEIKNSLDYIAREELQIKLRMCKRFGIRLLFIMRMAPKSYIEEIRQAGGYSLIFEWQLYPHGNEELARRVRERFGLRVDCPRAIERGTVERFLRWHVRDLGKGGVWVVVGFTER